MLVVSQLMWHSYVVLGLNSFHVVRETVLAERMTYWFNLLKPNDIYIYMSYRSANLQTLHFKYLFNKYTY